MENLLIGIGSSIFTVVLLTFISNLKTYIRLVKFNGEYLGYNLKGDTHSDGKYYFSFSLWNLFRLRNRIRMIGINGKNVWESLIYVDNSNPIISNGCFNYLDGGGWGVHKIEMNEMKREIFMTGSSKNNNKDYPYRLKKK